MFIGGGDDFFVAHRAAGLNHRGDACFTGCIDAVTEREEGVRSHDRSPDFQSGMFCLDPRDACAVDPAHLPGANANGHAVLAVDNSIRLDEFGDAPAEQQVIHFLVTGLALTYNVQLFVECKIGILYQQAAIDALEIEASLRRIQGAALEQANVFLLRYGTGCRVADTRCDDDLDELAFDYRFRSNTVEFAIESDDAAEG